MQRHRLLRDLYVYLHQHDGHGGIIDWYVLHGVNAVSTVGTLYDDTIKNGYAKLLSVSTVSTPVASIDLSCAYAGFDSYYFDLDQLMMDGLILRLLASADNGATYPTGGNQWVMHSMFLSSGANPYRSYANGVLGVYTYTQIAHAAYPGNAISGRVRLSNTDPRGNILFKTSGVFSTWYEMLNWGGAYMDGVVPVNKLRFCTDAGNIASGTVRTYGLRTGA